MTDSFRLYPALHVILNKIFLMDVVMVMYKHVYRYLLSIFREKMQRKPDDIETSTWIATLTATHSLSQELTDPMTEEGRQEVLLNSPISNAVLWI